MTNEQFDEFSSWVDRILLENADVRVAGYNFNLYEHVDEEFAIQLIGAKSFDVDESDWACDEVFSSGEDLFELPFSVVGRHWQDGLRVARSLVERYLETGKQAPRLKASEGVGVGFVQGDLELVYIRSGA